MNQIDVVVRQLCKKDARYAPDAYIFLMEALEFTMRTLDRDHREGTQRHVGGRELLAGIRAYAGELFGPLAPVVFAQWGIHRTSDFGSLVFKLIDAGQLSRQDSDSIDDFADGFEFEDAFVTQHKVDTGELRG